MFCCFELGFEKAMSGCRFLAFDAGSMAAAAAAAAAPAAAAAGAAATSSSSQNWISSRISGRDVPASEECVIATNFASFLARNWLVFCCFEWVSKRVSGCRFLALEGGQQAAVTSSGSSSCWFLPLAGLLIAAAAAAATIAFTIAADFEQAGAAAI